MRFLFVVMVMMALISCDRHRGKYINGVALPVVTVPDKDGQPLALESLRGSLVLVDVWASWCKPCRKQHPKLVKVYEDFRNAQFQKAKGFTIYQISLDADRDAWLKAIEKDNLHWPYHGSDLKGWESEVVALYQLEAIPSSFLLDENGLIIGKDLSANDLAKVLENRLLK